MTFLHLQILLTGRFSDNVIPGVWFQGFTSLKPVAYIRGYLWKMRDDRLIKPEFVERIVAACCYLSCGLIGLIYILAAGRDANSSFFRFHFLQSIVIGVFTYLLSWVEAIIKDILGGIAGLIFNIFAPAAGMIGIINSGVELFAFLISKLAYLLLLYGFVFALLGKYANIPLLSRLVYRQLRN
jgi:uncharacterized membrane protein